eukprot:TRINITY_DN9033_c0_g1_i1.p1 TRINITY_DN9033_c0_g1~~TRINITY_DN9033_c0_g1_i1.p1  ORF type:complete len:550 (-),score=168.86 TRINITY_DN9033_c0_g1_i1:87-1736(-)
MQGLLDGIKNFKTSNLRNIYTEEKKEVTVKDEPPKGSKGNYHWHFGHEDEEDKIEWYDEAAAFRQRAKELAQLIKSSKYVVVYTGAGISTAAKLPDYRGSDGMWTNRDAGTSYDKSKYVETISSALPTLAHMAIAELVKRGIVKSVVSTNVDGLHMRSGVPSEKLAELHGNSYLEVCQKCKHRYLRGQDILQYQTEEHKAVSRHWCGGKCEQPGCDGLLYDTIIAFGEFLPEDQLTLAENESKKGDLALVLGTTMMVQPACLLPGKIYKKKEGKMIICNLQKTQYDSKASFVMHGETDDLMYLVMEELGIPIPTSTESFVIPKYVENIDKKHEKKIAENKKKLEEIKREKLENPNGRSNAITRGENPYGKHVVTGQGLAEDEVNELKYGRVELVFFNHCKNGNYSLQSKSKKVVIEDCHDTIISIDDKVITHTMEVINSSNVTVKVNVPIFTVTCDNSKNIKLQFKDKDSFEMIAFAKAETSTLTIGDETIDVFSKLSFDPSKDQIVTRKNLTTGEIASSLTRRDYAGRITGLVQQGDAQEEQDKEEDN